MGAHAAVEARAGDAVVRMRDALHRGRGAEGADLAFELTGSPGALDSAIAATGVDGRIVIGSWYGTKTAPLALGGRFHRSRIRMVASQVSTLAPALRGRWSKESRFGVALSWLARIRPSQLVTHRVPLERAAEAYRLLCDEPQSVLQVLLVH
jgi:threonine dehydrogenase-like Zn-dependent dehydrogenase